MRAVVLLFFFFALANLQSAEIKSPVSPAPLPDMDRDGQELAARLRDAVPEGNSSFSGVLQIASRDDTVRFVPIASDISISPTNWVVTYRSTPTNGATAETLTITPCRRPAEPLRPCHRHQQSGFDSASRDLCRFGLLVDRPCVAQATF